MTLRIVTPRIVSMLAFALLVGCSPAPRPVGPIHEPADPEPEPEPVLITLEEDDVPDGEMCEASADCSDGQHCRGPAGCEEDWACGAARECGAETVSYCGCDATTFYAQENCPGRPYQDVGPCEALGEEVDDSLEGSRIEGNRICESDSDCRRGWVCAGREGCSTIWTCVPRRRMRPRCSRREATFCACDGTSFEASRTCPGQPYLFTGMCPGTEPVVVAEADPPPAPQVVTPPPPTPPTTPPRQVLGRPETGCRSNRDCRGGQVCQGPEGCETQWYCAPPPTACIADTQRFCSCDGQTFRASMTCPGRPHRHRGSCEPRQ